MILYETLYKRLNALVPGGLKKFMKESNGNGYKKLKSGAYMDLHIDRLSIERLSLAHNYVMNGDIMADPDMEIRIDVENGVAEALAFQQNTPPINVYTKVYPEPGMIDPKAKKNLNSFLLIWLKNLEAQGFYKYS